MYNVTSKTQNVGWENKNVELQLYLFLSCYQLKIENYKCKLVYVSLKVTAKQKPTDKEKGIDQLYISDTETECIPNRFPAKARECDTSTHY